VPFKRRSRWVDFSINFHQPGGLLIPPASYRASFLLPFFSAWECNATVLYDEDGAYGEAVSSGKRPWP
jgi:hypothetical protein